jgi:hypothetical protein
MEGLLAAAMQQCLAEQCLVAVRCWVLLLAMAAAAGLLAACCSSSSPS